MLESQGNANQIALKSYLQVWNILERFSIECRKTKNIVITLANRNRRKEHNNKTNQNSMQIHVTGAKRGKTRLDLVSFFIG